MSRNGLKLQFGVLVATISSAIASAQTAYWTNNIVGGELDHIGRARFGDKEEVIIPFREPAALAIDVEESRLYWTCLCLSQIHRCNLDGSECEALPISTVNSFGFALDVKNQRMYWTDLALQMIRSANFDGGMIENVLEDRYNLGVIALDLTNDRLYWSEGDYRIWRANMDGSLAEELFRLDFAVGMVVDGARGKLYCSQRGLQGNRLWRANLDGSEMEILVPLSTSPSAPDLDPEDGTVYWADWNGVRRLRADDAEPETVVMGNNSYALSYPFGFAVDLRRPGDCSEDQRTDLMDHAAFVDCMRGPLERLTRGCGCADTDGDGRVRTTQQSSGCLAPRNLRACGGLPSWGGDAG